MTRTTAANNKRTGSLPGRAKKIDLKPIGERIRTERKVRKLRQKEMAAELGISPNNLSDIENGKATPGADFLVKLRNIYNVDTEYILHGKPHSNTVSTPATPSTFDKSSVTEIDSPEKLVEFMNVSSYFKNTILALATKFIYENKGLINNIIDQRKK